MIKIVTHSGSFHPDDCFAVAMLILHLRQEGREAEVVRSRDMDVIKTGDYIVDVGGEYEPAKKRFDHHQRGGAGIRDNGVPYASFGLVWKEFGRSLCGSESVAQALDKKLVQPIDALDNGVGEVYPLVADVKPYMIQNLLFAYIPTWKEKQMSEDGAFAEACALAEKIIIREIEVQKDKEEGNVAVRVAYESATDKRIIVLDEAYLWADLIDQYPEPLIVVYPEGSGWHAKCVRTALGAFSTRISFPESWAGLRDEELAKVSGVSDAVFCHRQRFVVVAKSKEGAVALAKLTLKM